MSEYSLFDALKPNPMFAQLDTYAFQIIENYLSFKALDPKEVLFNEGDRGDYVAVVVAGKLEIVKNTCKNTPYNINSLNTDPCCTTSGHQNVQTTRLATMKVGDSIGEMSIIDELARSATVRALKKSGIVILPKKHFDVILEDHPRIGISMLKGIATMLSINLRRTSATLSQKDSPNSF